MLKSFKMLKFHKNLLIILIIYYQFNKIKAGVCNILN